jgi:hypothetical protein
MKVFKALLGLFCSGVLATGFLLVQDKFVWDLDSSTIFWIAFVPNLIFLRSIVDFVSEHIDKIFDLDTSSDRHLVFKELEEKIAKANEDWTPNFDDGDEKYYPWFDLTKGKVTLCHVLYDCNRSNVPSPMVFKSEKVCKKFVEENIGLYEKLYK